MKLREFLSTRPYFGIFCPFLVSVGLKAGDLLPFFQVAGVVIGCGVGLLTGYLKILEIKEKRADRRQKELDGILLQKEQKALAQQAGKNPNGTA